jgi:PiT family inorganic phosphate transporter
LPKILDCEIGTLGDYSSMSSLVIAPILGLAVAYGYLNGMHGSASIVATMISSRALGPRQALFLAAVGISAGPFLLGVAVANTVGAQLVSREAATAGVVIAGLLGAITWSALTLWLRIPISISQALVGGVIGAALIGFGQQAVLLPGLQKTLLGLFMSPFSDCWWDTLAFVWHTSGRICTPHINRWINRDKSWSRCSWRFRFGANDGQKIMG